MGILDSEFARIVLSGSPYMKAQEAQRREDELGARYSSLLGEYTGAQMGPPTEGIALARQDMAQGGGMPQAFYDRAAAIPGYQGLATGGQSNMGAMDRLRYQNDWSLKNVPLQAQQALEQNASQFNQTMAENQRQYANPSAYQTANLAQQAAESKARLDATWAEIELRRKEAQRLASADPFNPLKLAGKDVAARNIDAARLDQTASITEDVTRYLNERSATGRIANPTQAALAGAAWNLAVVPFIARLSQTGVVQASEMPRIQKLMGDPASWTQFTDKEKSQVQMINRMMQDERAAFYAGHGLRAPAVQPGASAFSYGSAAGANAGRAPGPDLIPYDPNSMRRPLNSGSLLGDPNAR